MRFFDNGWMADWSWLFLTYHPLALSNTSPFHLDFSVTSSDYIHKKDYYLYKWHYTFDLKGMFIYIFIWGLEHKYVFKKCWIAKKEKRSDVYTSTYVIIHTSAGDVLCIVM